MKHRPSSCFAINDLLSTSPVMDAIAAIDGMIASGQLAPGERLVEEDLSKQLGIARGRVREALRLLAGRGVVELIPYKGARVRRLSHCEAIALHEVVTGLFCVSLVLLSLRFHSAKEKDKAAFLVLSAAVTEQSKTATIRRLIALLLQYHAFVNEFSGNAHLVRLSGGLQLGYYYEALLDHSNEEKLRHCFSNAQEIADVIQLGDTQRLLPLVWGAITPILQSLHVPQPFTPPPLSSLSTPVCTDKRNFNIRPEDF